MSLFVLKLNDCTVSVGSVILIRRKKREKFQTREGSLNCYHLFSLAGSVDLGKRLQPNSKVGPRRSGYVADGCGGFAV